MYVCTFNTYGSTRYETTASLVNFKLWLWPMSAQVYSGVHVVSRCVGCTSLCPHRQSRSSQRHQRATHPHCHLAHWQARQRSKGLLVVVAYRQTPKRITRGFHRHVTRSNATYRTAPQFRQHAASTCWRIQHGSNWLPQALALPTFFATFLSKENACGAMRYVTESFRYDGNYTPKFSQCLNLFGAFTWLIRRASGL